MNELEQILKKLFYDWAGKEAESFITLPRSGSSRKYFRLAAGSKSAIGAQNYSIRENEAFLTLTNHFQKKNFNVPEIYGFDKSNRIYLMQDLGDETLYSFLQKKGKNNFSKDVIDQYENAIQNLINFQIGGYKDLDFSVCYPRSNFDHQSMLWDLNYWKYYFLKLTDIYFDEQKLEDDFNTFINFLLKAETNYFLYRDFQSRNIMLHDTQQYYIDYQGGRKGALQYDIASLLLDAKANIPQTTRDELLQFYLEKASAKTKINKKDFLKYYNGYALIRLLQAMGAYGYRGIYQKKVHFLQSIPLALKNLRSILANSFPAVKVYELQRVLKQICEEESFNKYNFSTSNEKLKVTITSFSYKNEIPTDLSGNGGGFVFDCRAITNPGRIEKYKKLTGLDQEVKNYIENQEEAKRFLENIFNIIDAAVSNYIERDFKHLMVNFGCTGGQHRSVYCAEKLAEHIKNNFNVLVDVKHTQLKKLSI